jgi:hypothetical protein
MYVSYQGVMSKVNTSKNAGHISKALKRKSINNSSYSLMLAVSMATLLAMCMLSLTPSVNIAHAQTTNQSSTSNNVSSSSTNNTSATTTAGTSAADKTGTITSVQNDQAGTWKLSGTWNFKNLNSNSPTFTSTFSMMKMDGSAMHKHTISDFKLAGNPTKTSTGTTYNGTATVSMKQGPVSSVPISITLSDNGNTSIMIDPKTTNNHFGNTPIEGKVTA